MKDRDRLRVRGKPTVYSDTCRNIPVGLGEYTLDFLGSMLIEIQELNRMLNLTVFKENLFTMPKKEEENKGD